MYVCRERGEMDGSNRAARSWRWRQLPQHVQRCACAAHSLGRSFRSRRQLSATSQALLRGYVDAYERVLSIAVRRSMEATDWLNHKEPRAPRLVCDFILEKAAGRPGGVGYRVGEWAGGRAGWSSARAPVLNLCLLL